MVSSLNSCFIFIFIYFGICLLRLCRHDKYVRSPIETSECWSRFTKISRSLTCQAWLKDRKMKRKSIRATTSIIQCLHGLVRACELSQLFHNCSALVLYPAAIPAISLSTFSSKSTYWTHRRIRIILIIIQRTAWSSSTGISHICFQFYMSWSNWDSCCRYRNWSNRSLNQISSLLCHIELMLIWRQAKQEKKTGAILYTIEKDKVPTWRRWATANRSFSANWESTYGETSPEWDFIRDSFTGH